MNWYKKAKNIYKEASMNVWIPESNLPQKNDTMFELSQDIWTSSSEFLKRIFSEKEMEYFQKNNIHEYIDFDLSSTDMNAQNGTINVYTKGFPKNKIQALIDFVGKELERRKVDFKYPTQLEQSGAYDSYVLRFKINRIPKDILDRPPEVNLANENARRIFGGILGYKENEYTFEMDAKDLLYRIDNVRKDRISEFVHEGLEGDQIPDPFGQVPDPFGQEDDPSLHVNDFLQQEPSEYDNSKETGKGIRMFEPAKPIEYYERALSRIKEVAYWAVKNRFKTILVN